MEPMGAMQIRQMWLSQLSASGSSGARFLHHLWAYIRTRPDVCANAETVSSVPDNADNGARIEIRMRRFVR